MWRKSSSKNCDCKENSEVTGGNGGNRGSPGPSLPQFLNHGISAHCGDPRDAGVFEAVDELCGAVNLSEIALIFGDGYHPEQVDGVALELR